LFLVLLVGAGLYFWMSQPKPIDGATATPQPPPSPTAPAPPVAGPTGVLVIDAAPWGQVVEVVDSSGKHHEPSDARFTPMALALPPGTYTIEVTNPSAREPFSRKATVRADTIETVSVVFRRVDPQEYFQRTGL
jgi:hypothetical protein